MSSFPNDATTGIQLSRDRNTLDALCPSPISKLPTELMMEIFYHYTTTGGFAPLDTRSEPWNLAQVSSCWRALVLSYRDLWSRLDLDFGRTFSPMMLCEMLQRSNNAPLDLILSNCDDPRHVNLALDLVCTTAHRWKEVIIKQLTLRLLRLFDSDMNLEFPMLEALVIEDVVHGLLPDDSTHQLALPLSIFGLTAPNLKAVMIPELGSKLVMLLRWGHLEVFEGDLVPWNPAAWYGFRVASQLVTACIYVGSDMPLTAEELRTTRSYPDLLHLSLRLDRHADLSLLDNATAPSLDVLEIFVHSAPHLSLQPDIIPQMEQFIQRSACGQTLVRLTVCLQANRLQAGIINVLRETPNLRKLHLGVLHMAETQEYSFEEGILEALAFEIPYPDFPAPRNLLLRLEDLAIMGNFDSVILRKMMLSRLDRDATWPHSPTLSRVKIVCGRETIAEVLELKKVRKFLMCSTFQFSVQLFTKRMDPNFEDDM